jgi:D-alanyl-lipoteichoic acid acyltransferase DltB (MBOAT superfamily)
LLSGLWHGANYTFIAWGAIHGLLMIIFILYRKLTGLPSAKGYYLKLPSMFFTFFIVSLAWIFFRANNITDASYIITKIFSFNFSGFTLMLTDATNRVEFGKTSMLISFLSIGILFLNDRFQKVDQSSLQQKPIADILYNAFILFLVIAAGVFNQTNFIYFQF